MHLLSAAVEPPAISCRAHCLLGRIGRLWEWRAGWGYSPEVDGAVPSRGEESFRPSFPTVVREVARWCSSDGLNLKIKKLRKEAPDAKVLSRFKVHDHHMARAIAIHFNQKDNSFVREGGRDIFKWTENPSYLNEFRSWDRDGNKVLNKN